MKPKTIAEYVDLIMERGVMVEHNLTNTTKEQEVEHWTAQIQQLLEECAPKKHYKQDEAWRIAVNKTIDQYKSNIRGRLR